MVRRAFRAVSLLAIMAALLVLYRAHPLAGWATLAVLGVGTVVARRRRIGALVAN